MADLIQVRRDTQENWSTINPVLQLAEPGLETDTRKMKYGDGVTPWNDLPYASNLTPQQEIDLEESLKRVVKWEGTLDVSENWTFTIPNHTFTELREIVDAGNFIHISFTYQDSVWDFVSTRGLFDYFFVTIDTTFHEYNDTIGIYMLAATAGDNDSIELSLHLYDSYNYYKKDEVDEKISDAATPLENNKLGLSVVDSLPSPFSAETNKLYLINDVDNRFYRGYFTNGTNWIPLGYLKPVNGIPKTDLASDVQSLLNKAVLNQAGPASEYSTLITAANDANAEATISLNKNGGSVDIHGKGTQIMMSSNGIDINAGSSTYPNAKLRYNTVEVATVEGLNRKQDKLTFDSAPTANSTNPVTSGGVKADLDTKADADAVAYVGNVVAAETDVDLTEIDAVPTAGSNNAVSSGGVYEKIMFQSYNPLAGMTPGNLSGDTTIAIILKEIWLEVLNDNVVLPESIKFFLIGNTETSGYVFQMKDVSNASPIVSINGTPKMAGVNDVIMNGVGTAYAGKIKIHATFDFTNETSNINMGDTYTNTTFLVSAMNRSVGENISVKEKVGAVSEELAATNEELDATQSYSNALKGVTIGDDNFYTYIKSIWGEVRDTSVSIPTIKKIQLKNYASSSIHFIFSGQDANDNYVFSNTSTAVVTPGLREVVVNGYGSYRGVFQLHIIMDVPESLNLYAFADTEMEISELNRRETKTLTVKEKIAELDAPLSGKTIVCFGDSVTEFGASTVGSYPNWIGYVTGANTINIGIGGTQFRQRTTPVLNPTTSNQGYAGLDIINVIRAAAGVSFDETHTYMDVVQNAADYIYSSLGDDNRGQASRLAAIDWSKVDAVTIAGGTNDWNNGGGAIGASGSEDPNYTLGAINLIIKTLLTAYPHLSIYWLTPIVHWAGPIAERTLANWGDVEERNGYTLKAFSALISDEVVKQHIPVCDLYNTLGWNMWNFSNYFNDTDGTHPAQGYDEMGRKIAAFIISNRTF